MSLQKSENQLGAKQQGASRQGDGHGKRGASETQTTDAASVPTPFHLYVLDDDSAILQCMKLVADDMNIGFTGFSSAEEFLAHPEFQRPACLILDHALGGGMTGLPLIRSSSNSSSPPTTLVLSGQADLPVAVEYMRAGALTVIEKPISQSQLVSAINEALEVDQQAWKDLQFHAEMTRHFENLSARRKSVLEFVLAGRVNKWIARELGVSDRTIELDRAWLLKEFQAENFVALSGMIASMQQHDRKRSAPQSMAPDAAGISNDHS